MAPLSAELAERARKNLTMLLRGLASAGQARVAEALGMSESTVSRMKSEGDLERLSALLALIGLKAVPISYECYPPEEVDWMLLGNRIAAQRIKSREHLTEEDPE